MIQNAVAFAEIIDFNYCAGEIICCIDYEQIDRCLGIMGWFNKIFKGSNQRFRVGTDHNHNGYYGNYQNTSHDEPTPDTDADHDESHTQEPSTSEVSILQMV